MDTNQQKKRKLAAVLLLLHQQIEDEEEELVFRDRVKFRKAENDIYKRRNDESAFKVLINRHLIDEEEKFKDYFRISREQFAFILPLIENELRLESCHRVKLPITPAEKLGLTLRFLATGESYRSLALSFRISPSTISGFVPKVLLQLKEKLCPKLLPPPNEIDWAEKAQEFWTLWNFPNCIAAIDGKHVQIVAPSIMGSTVINKGYSSIVFLAMVDANCKFTVIDVGSYGAEDDADIFNKSKIKLLVEKKSIFPPPHHLPDSVLIVPHVIVGDEAFTLSKHVMKPYCKNRISNNEKKRTFNYRLDMARRASENAFGILCATFKIFYTPINVRPETVDLIVTACSCLHNMLREEYLSTHTSRTGFQISHQHDVPTKNMFPLSRSVGSSKSEGLEVRSKFSDYFVSESNNFVFENTSNL